MTPESAFQLALMHRQAGRLAESEALLRQIVAVRPDVPDAWHQLGLVALTAGRPGDAVEWLGRAVALNPGNANYLSDQGVALCHAGRGEEAVPVYERAVQFAPNAPHIHRNLGDVLAGLGEIDAAIASYQRTLALAPNDAGAHNNLGNVYLRLQRLPEAAAAYERAAQADPRLLPAVSNWGDVLTKLGQPEAGLALAQRVVALDPRFPDGYLNMGVACWHMRRFAEAEAYYRKALTLRPDFDHAHLNLGIILLLTGRYEEGWREYEWHWRAATHNSRQRDFSAPPWKGHPLPGQTLCTYGDQGVGDTIQFLRYLPILQERSGAAHVIVECQPELLSLVEQLRNEKLRFIPRVPSDKTVPPHDHHVPLFSLPQVLQRYEPLAMTEPYLHADDARRALWRSRLDAGAKLRVGLAWAGNSSHQDDRRRSMPPEAMLPLLDVPGVSFVSLQVQPRGSLPPALAAAGVLDFTSDIQDFADTAALVAELDLTIVVDTSTGHVAGALGRPVWVMLPFIPDWRWGMDRENTPWYPTMRLFRQAKAGDWATVIEGVKAALLAKVESEK